MTNPYDLLSAYFLKNITPEQFEELSAWLQEDPKHIQILVHESLLHEGIHHTLTGEQLRQAEGLLEVDHSWNETANNFFELPPLPKPSCDEERVREIESYARKKLDAFLREQQSQTPVTSSQPRWSFKESLDHARTTIYIMFQRTVTLAKVTAVVLIFALVSLIVTVYVHTHRSVAVIAGNTEAVWRVPKEPEASLYRGWYHLESGFARILMRKGTEVLLQAPCDFELTSANELYLGGGTVCATVPQRAQGFTIETATSKIVDYGTEFGAMVGSDNQMEVHVFKGEVGVGARTATLERGLKDIEEGDAAVLEKNQKVSVHPREERTSLFLRTLPNDMGVGVPGKRIDLADIVGNGNGYGSGQLGYGIDLNNGEVNPFQMINRIAARSGYIALPHMAFVDGVFVPDRSEDGPLTITSTGLTFDNCPDTYGQCRGYVINGAIFGARVIDNQDNVHFGQLQGQAYASKQFSSIGMHANTGITFDLDALRQSIQNRKIDRFTSLCGVSETSVKSFDGYYGEDRYRVTVDFWVLVDGHVRFHRRLNAVPSEPVKVDIELASTSRFLTLMTTDTQGRISFCWGMFAQPALELIK